jgi:signal transduction histidine kinase
MKPLRVLIVEDREDDMHLILLHLKKGGYMPTYERVDTEEHMLAQLQAQEWDLILADYNMPSFNGLQALKVLGESDFDVPFILVSGAIGEETAVQAMKAGAHDYLLKDNLIRLVPAIERTMQDARERSLRRNAEDMRAHLEKDLQIAKEAAEMANRRKSRVLAFVAHEFKNPLKAIETFVEILEKKNLPEDQRTIVSGIGTASQHLRVLLNDILDIAPIEAGEVKLQYEKVSLKTILDEVQVITQEAARLRQIEIVHENSLGDVWINVDAKRVRQVLINLLSNATKYTNTGDTILLKVGLSDEKDPQWLRMQVIDHGPGIPEEELEKLFLDYYRVKNMLSKQKEGLGLGLALVKNLVECHQGQVSVQSQLGEGTTFTVDFPRSVLIPAPNSSFFPGMPLPI